MSYTFVWSVFFFSTVLWATQVLVDMKLAIIFITTVVILTCLQAFVSASLPNDVIDNWLKDHTSRSQSAKNAVCLYTIYIHSISRIYCVYFIPLQAEQQFVGDLISHVSHTITPPTSPPPDFPIFPGPDNNLPGLSPFFCDKQLRGFIESKKNELKNLQENVGRLCGWNSWNNEQ